MSICIRIDREREIVLDIHLGEHVYPPLSRHIWNNILWFLGGTTCAMVLVQWALLHEMRLMTTFDGLKDDWRHEEKRRKQGRRHWTSSIEQVVPPKVQTLHLARVLTPEGARVLLPNALAGHLLLRAVSPAVHVRGPVPRNACAVGHRHEHQYDLGAGQDCRDLLAPAQRVQWHSYVP